MLQSELKEACYEYEQEIDAEMRRMVKEADEGAVFDLERYATLSNESVLLVALQACALSLGARHNGPKAENFREN